MLRFHGSEKTSVLFELIHQRKWTDVFKMLRQSPQLAITQETSSRIEPFSSIVECALLQGDIATVNQLLSAYPSVYKCASPSIVSLLINEKNWNAILYLIGHGFLSANYVMSYGDGYRSILDWAKQDTDSSNVKILIERHQAKAYQVLCAEAALFCAAEYDDWQSVFAFLDQSCVSVNARNISHPNGWTLLNYAYFHRQPYAFLSLINDYKADLHLAIEACAGIQALISFQWNASYWNARQATTSIEPTVDSEIADDPDAQKKHSAQQKKVASSAVPIAKSASSMQDLLLVEKLEALQLEREETVSSSISSEAKDKFLVFSKSAQSSSEKWGLKALHRDFPPPKDTGVDPVVVPPAKPYTPRI